MQTRNSHDHYQYREPQLYRSTRDAYHFVDEHPMPMQYQMRMANRNPPELSHQTENTPPSAVSGYASAHPSRIPVTYRQSPSPLSNNNSPNNYIEDVPPQYANDTSQVGFVQRVKQALEGNTSTEETHSKPAPLCILQPVEELQAQDVAELPASPIVKRLTRDMIKAAVGPPSETDAQSPDAPASVVSLANGDDSSGEESSPQARSSMDLPSPSPSPELQDKDASRPQTLPVTASTSPNVASREAGGTRPASMAACTSSSQGPFTVSKVPTEPAHELENGPVDESDSPRESESSQNDVSSSVTSDRRPVTLPYPSQPKRSSSSMDRQSLRPLIEIRNPPSHVPAPLATLKKPLVPDSSEEDTDPGEATRQSETSAPSSAHTSLRSLSRPGSVTDPLNWATSSILARKSFNADSSRRSSVSTLVEPLGPRVNLTTPPSIPTNTATFSDYPPNQAMATVDSSALSVPTSLPPNETRMSAMKQFHFPLPDLTEDSQEDASTTNLRMLGSKPPNFRSGGHRKVRREPRIPPRTDLILIAKVAEPPASYLSTKLGNTRNIPSLNFSHSDLTTKLNLALGLTSPASLEELKDIIATEKAKPVSDQAISKADLRERYKSFFSEYEIPEEESEQSPIFVKRASSPPTAFIDELEQLSIPSVQGLTVRLSELLPSIKKGESFLDLTKSEQAFDDAVDKIRDLGSQEDVDDVDRQRTSLISALSAGAVAKLRRSGNSPARAKERYSAHLDKDLPLLPTEGRDPRPSLATDGSRGAQEQDAEANGDKPPELAATSPVETADGRKGDVLTKRSTHNATKTAPKRSSGRGRQQAARVSRHDADIEDVSSDDDPTIEIPISTGSHAKRLFIPQPKYKIRRSRSMMDLPSDQAEHIVRSMSPGPNTEFDLVPKDDDAGTGEDTRQSRKGIIGSIQRKIGARKARADKSDWHVDPSFLHPEEPTFTGPGDRYPTTSLTPPNHVNMDEARSYFSDDSSLDEDVRAGALKKRLTRLKNRHSTQQGQRQRNSRGMAMRESQQSKQPPQACWLREHRSFSSLSQRTTMTHPEVVVVYESPPAGMSKLEFRVKRVLEKFRIFWCRSGEVVRSISRTRRDRRDPPSWYEGSDVYDGT